MKQINLIAIMGIAVSSFFYSCSTERELENESSQNLENLLSSRDSEVCDIFSNATESTLIPGIKAVNIDNGILSTCNNNILIFPTLQSYEDAITILDHQIDNYNDNFDQLTVNMTDVEADDYADEIGFNEDAPLLIFEEELSFCSLRQNIETLEEDWISQQGDGAWNLNADPDNHYIDDETERALLNVGSEFIVGNCKDGYTYYKIFEWGTVEIEINDISSLSNILIAINNITNPTMTQVDDILAASDTPYKIDVAPAYNNLPPLSTDCKEAAKEKGEEVFTSDRRIKWKNKFYRKSGVGSSPSIKGKALTKSYRKKKGKWKKFRATITAGLDGIVYNNCSNTVSFADSKNKRRKRLKLTKQIGDPGNYQLHKLKPNKLNSVHKQEGSYFQDEVY